MRTYPYRFYVALDGNGINGFEGMAGVCLFLFDPSDNSYAYKVQYFDGAAAGHATTVNPSRSVGFLGNAGQHLLFYDAATLDEVDRVSTLQYEVNDTTLRGSTHLVWLDDSEFITAVGDYLYRFDLNRLGKGERLGPHGLKLPHAMKLTASGRYIVYGGMDSPVTGEAKEVGIYDLQQRGGETGRAPGHLLAPGHPPDRRPLLSRLVPGRAPRGAGLEGLGHRVLQGVRLRDRCRVGAGASALGRRSGDPGAPQLRRHSLRQRAHLLQRGKPEHHVHRSGVLRRVAVRRRAARAPRTGQGRTPSRHPGL